MNIAVLGGGLSAVSLAYFLQDEELIDKIIIIEKEKDLGGLCRSFYLDGVCFDIGPHIIFSKNENTLDFMRKLLGKNISKKRRSNRILHKGVRIQYPFENDLSMLSQEESRLCVNTFLNNPYENYQPANMLQFFLRTFGEGITNLYLRPYNEKIWKFDPAFLDLQMVERIPKPPPEDIINSAAGKTIDGHLHQLYFYYPIQGGTASLIKVITDCLNNKVEIHTENTVKLIDKQLNGYSVDTDGGNYFCNQLISTIPVNELCQIFSKTPENIREAGRRLRYNSIAILIFQLSDDFAGDNTAFMIADKEVIFHRITKIDFLGESYKKSNAVTYMAEITYRDGDAISETTDGELLKKGIEGLQKIGFMDSKTTVINKSIMRFEYAYVVYDLLHKFHMEQIRGYFSEQGIFLNGRFGNFEYWNMDTVIEESMKLSERIINSVKVGCQNE